jgi:hypothetical protein
MTADTDSRDRVARAICNAMELDCTRERGDCALCGDAAEAAISEIKGGGMMVESKASDGLFVGQNHLEINTGTMNAILTEWLRREVASPMEVTSCVSRANGEGFRLTMKVGA